MDVSTFSEGSEIDLDSVGRIGRAGGGADASGEEDILVSVETVGEDDDLWSITHSS